MSTEDQSDENGSELDAPINKDFITVGIGASAGGIKALKEFFSAMPADPGMAFVVILHLSPTHESNLAEILQRETKMPVVQVGDAVKVRPNEVYVIPPNRNLAMMDGTIAATDFGAHKGSRVAIDLFFRTLANAYGRNGVCIVMSGTGTDGTVGLKRVKESDGFAIVQDPDDAEYDDMPRSAIATHLVDWVLPVAEMPARLLKFRESSERMRLTGGYDSRKGPDFAGLEALPELLTLLRIRTGHDFTNYKQATLLRRIARHLQVYNLEDLSEYLQMLRDKPEDLQSLLKNLLINVTNFFRDKEAFQSLENEVIPRLFVGKKGGDAVRVWSAGCASGEEAFSIAMLLAEFASKLGDPPKIQVFGTDVDEDAISEARDHRYPPAIEADVTPERLRRFFVRDGEHYVVRKDLREMILFAPHNVLRDPPFSRLDLISCRNLLIYLNRDAQEKVHQIFHFALNPDGYLFLGNSESAEGQPNLFSPLDKKHRIYSRRAAVTNYKLAPVLPVRGEWQLKLTEQPRHLETDRAMSFGDIHYRLVEQYAPPSVLVNEDFEFVHLSESAGRFLHFSGGEPSKNVLKAIHPDLLPDLRAALYASQREGKASEFREIRVETETGVIFVNVIVRPVDIPEAGRDFLLIVFDEINPPVKAPSDQEPRIQLDRDEANDTVTRRLEEELRRTKDRLRNTIEQHETSIEELKASNEELQAINEELRSASEELETSKEELQSVNEELTTVNHELKDKVDEVSRTNSDLQNLMASTEIATIFVDRSLNIKRYTPRTRELFNIIPTDTGRPLSHITHRLARDDFQADATRVLETLHNSEREVRSLDGRVFLARFAPYRTMDDKIDGVVLSFIDITSRKGAEADLHESDERLRLLIESATDIAIFTTDRSGVVNSWNTGSERLFGYTEAEIVGQHVRLVFTPEDRNGGAPEKEMETALATGRALDERWHQRKDGSRFFASGVLQPLGTEVGAGFVKIARDMTARVVTESVKREKELLQTLVSAQEMERARIARDLHDELGQQITALRLKLELLRDRTGDDIRHSLDEIREMARGIDEGVDFLAWELRPTALDDLGLIPAITKYLNEWSGYSGVATSFTPSIGRLRLSTPVETAVYRVVQESLNNVHKHAAAKTVSVQLALRDNNVVLTIDDDGMGYDQENAGLRKQGMGLTGMDERVKLIGGALEIESNPGSGTTVYVRIPITPEVTLPAAGLDQLSEDEGTIH